MVPLTNTTAMPGLDRLRPGPLGRSPPARRGATSRARELVTTFGHGPHRCPAQRFSLSAIGRAVRRLLDAYELEPEFDRGPPAPAADRRRRPRRRTPARWPTGGAEPSLAPAHEDQLAPDVEAVPVSPDRVGASIGVRFHSRSSRSDAVPATVQSPTQPAAGVTTSTRSGPICTCHVRFAVGGLAARVDGAPSTASVGGGPRSRTRNSSIPSSAASPLIVGDRAGRALDVDAMDRGLVHLPPGPERER